MILVLSLLNVVLGTSLACAAVKMPAHSISLERWGGTLFVSGLALIGYMLPPPL